MLLIFTFGTSLEIQRRLKNYWNQGIYFFMYSSFKCLAQTKLRTFCLKPKQNRIVFKLKKKKLKCLEMCFKIITETFLTIQNH